jgi:HD superfamily phosphohydrolase
VPFVIRDPMLGDIELTPPERHVLDSDIFQRQRGVKQLGTSLLLYPSAVQTRFVHALGNLKIAGQMISRALDSDPVVAEAYLREARAWLVESAEVTEQREAIARAGLVDIRERIEQVARIAGMCHDLGHFPMGHVLEDALSNKEIVERLFERDGPKEWGEWVTLRGAAVHEYATIQLLANNGGGRWAGSRPERARPFRLEDDWLRTAVLAVIKATHVKGGSSPHPIARSIAELISDEIDSDRAEYLRRDSAVSGAGYGQYDNERLIASYTIARDGSTFLFRPSSRALAAVETFLHERVKAYGHLYYHNLGYLMDALLGAVLLALYRPSQIAILRAELAETDRARFDSTLGVLPLERLHYDNFDDPSGYVDDTTLWHFLREVLGWLEGLALGDHQMELRRLRLYLRALLRRRHVWISLWKYPEDFEAISETALDAFCRVVRRKFPGETQERIRRAITIQLSRRIRQDISTTRVSVLNYFAHEFREEERLRLLARALEARLRARRPDWLKGELFVEYGERAKFKPLKTPGSYRLVDAQGALRRLRDLAPAAVNAIVSWWFDGYPQLRMFVITEAELDKDRRRDLQGLALHELPAAVEEWYARVPQQLDPSQVLAGE